MASFHLAQINITKAKAEMESPIMQGFVERLDEINQLAENSPGFIWRLQTEDDVATVIQAFDDPKLVVNMSVWKDLESLKNYVYKSAHIELIRDRSAWFNKMLEAQLVLWWIPEGAVPSVEDGKKKLEYLEQNGSSQLAFTFAKSYPQPK